MELPQRKRVKVEQEAEEVSTVTRGKVVVSAMGSARVISSNQPVADKTSHKVPDKTMTARTTKNEGALSKKKSSFVRSDSINVAAVKRRKRSHQQEETSHKASKSSKHSASQQPPRKKKRSV